MKTHTQEPIKKMSKIQLITFDLDDTFWDIKSTIINAEMNSRKWSEDRIGEKIEWGMHHKLETAASSRRATSRGFSRSNCRTIPRRSHPLAGRSTARCAMCQTTPLCTGVCSKGRAGPAISKTSKLPRTLPSLP